MINLSEEYNFNQNLVWIYKIPRIFFCMKAYTDENAWEQQYIIFLLSIGKRRFAIEVPLFNGQTFCVYILLFAIKAPRFNGQTFCVYTLLLEDEIRAVN